MCYFIIAWYDGPNFLQYKGIISWVFSAPLKVYKTEARAISKAKQIKARYGYEKVGVYKLPDGMRIDACWASMGRYDKYLIYNTEIDYGD